MGKQCVWCGEANQEKQVQQESEVGVFLCTADWAHIHIQTGPTHYEYTHRGTQ